MLIWLLPDKMVEKKYIKAGAAFGDAVSYIYMGRCVGFEKLFENWRKWEAEYARRGYHTVSLDDFIEYGGYGKTIKKLGIKRQQDEKPVFHAEIYRQKYLGKEEALVDRPTVTEVEVKTKKGERVKRPVFSGCYELPTTEAVDEKPTK